MKKNKFVTLPCSFGEAYDKLSILHIKLNYLRDDAVERVKDEISAISSYVPLIDENVTFHFKTLKYINNQIWTSQEILRGTQKWGDSELNKLIHQLNDQRFRIKRKLNNICESEISEQKSYGSKVAFFYPGFNLSDSVIGIGAARYLSTLYDSVLFYVSEENKSSIEAIVQDDVSIKIQSFKNSKEANDFYERQKNKNSMEDNNYFYTREEDDDNNKEIDDTSLRCYDHFNLDKEIFWEFFHCASVTVTDSQLAHLGKGFVLEKSVLLESHLSKSPSHLVENIKKGLNMY
jgi:hypothetical protein